MLGLREDLESAGRSLARRPALAALTALILAVGIGAATTVFSVVDQTLLRRPPFPHAKRVVDVMSLFRRDGGQSGSHTADKAVGWRSETQVFERFETYSPRWYDIAADPEPRQIRGMGVSPGLFDLLGVRPFAGRGFVADDTVPGADQVVVLSEPLAVRTFGTAAAALGAPLPLSGRPYTVVGVIASTVMLFGDEQVWLPIDPARHLGSPSQQNFFVLGRLPVGLSIAEAQARADTIAERWQVDSPLRRGSWFVHLQEKRAAWVAPSTRLALLGLLAGVGCLLALTCVTASLLVLARVQERRVDLAVRSALGAARARLLREVMLDVGLVACPGGAAGILASHWLVQALATDTIADLIARQTTPLGVDLRVLLAATAATTLTAMAAGLLPALQATRPGMDDALHQRPTAATGAERLSSALVGVQVACTVALVVGALLTARTMANVHAIDLGVDPSRVLVANVDLLASRYPTERARFEYFERVRARLSSSAQIESHAVAGYLASFGYGYWDFETPAGPVTESVQTSMNRVSDGYFETLGIRLIAGRTFTAADMGAPVLVVSRSFASRLWPAGDAVGSWLRDRDDATGLRRTVIGVVEDIDARVESQTRMDLQWYEPWPRHDEMAEAAPVAQQTYFPHRLLVKTTDARVTTAAVNAAVWAEDPLQPVNEVAAAADLFVEVFARQRLAQRVIGAFAAFAVVLAATGIFGVLSHAVNRRRREIGVRVALGATPPQVQRLMLGQAGLTLVLGITGGLVGAVFLARTLHAVLFEVPPLDPASFAGAAVVTVAVGLTAAWWPAQRAARTQPSIVLRAE